MPQSLTFGVIFGLTATFLASPLTLGCFANSGFFPHQWMYLVANTPFSSPIQTNPFNSVAGVLKASKYIQYLISYSDPDIHWNICLYHQCSSSVGYGCKSNFRQNVLLWHCSSCEFECDSQLPVTALTPLIQQFILSSIVHAQEFHWLATLLPFLELRTCWFHHAVLG